VVHPQIAAFARLAGENTPPLRTLEGQKTKISRSMHGFGYDAIHDEIVVTSPLAQAILIFRGGANGEEPPIRVIQGPHTQMIGGPTGSLDMVSVDPVHDEIYLPNARSDVLVFDRTANGDVAPKRIIKGVRGSSIAVDPMRDLLVIGGGRAISIYPRTVSGDAKPIRVISGPKSDPAGGEVQLYPPKGLIVGGCGQATYPFLAVCAWSINDSGDAPPRWKIPVQELTQYQPAAIALDPVHKEIMLVASGRKVQLAHPPITNTVMTFSWPEIFQ